VPSFNDAPTTNDYQPQGSGAPTIEDILPLPNGGGRFNVNSSFGAVLCQVQYGGQGAVEWAENEEQLLNPGAYGTIPEDACGIRFRSAVAGTPGKVSASIGTDPTRPALSIDALGSVLLVSPVTVTQQIFAGVNGTYTPPVGLKAVLFECIGGGGGGGGAAATGVGQASAGAGGGGGGYSSTLIQAADLPTSLAIAFTAIGAGGGPGGAGTVGSRSSVGNIPFPCVAFGGAGGGAGPASAAGRSGTPGAGGNSGLGLGDITEDGSPGDWGWVVAALPGAGIGGAAARGGGGGSNAGAGGQYGGGGSGGGAGASSAGQAGGNGAPGLVVATEFY
jgi:hypothetical protein